MADQDKETMMAYISVSEAIDTRIFPMGLAMTMVNYGSIGQSEFATEFDSGRLFNGVVLDDEQTLGQDLGWNTTLNYRDLVVDSNQVAIGGILTDFWIYYPPIDPMVTGVAQIVMTGFELVLDTFIGPGASRTDSEIMVELFGRDDVFDMSPGRDLVFGYGGNDDMNGRGGGDLLCGMAGMDSLDGGQGRDVLSGGRHNDVLTGGGGADKFVFALDGGCDVVNDFAEGDLIRIRSGAADISDLTIADLGFGTAIAFDTVTVLLVGVSASDIDAGDFIFG